MTRLSVIPNVEFLQEPGLKTFPTTGFVPFAAQRKLILPKK